MKEIKLFINNQFVNGSDKKTLSSINPATGEQSYLIHLPSKKDVDTAVQSAYSAYHSKEWKKASVAERSDLLLKIAEKIKERNKELVEHEIINSGSTLRKAKADIHNTASFFKVLSKTIKDFAFFEQDEKATTAGFSKNYRYYQSVGVCAQIIPWNFPLVMAGWKIGPVIASGCTTVLKSAIETPVTASILAEIIKDAGVPSGVINIITGGADIGQALVQHSLVNKIAFTGSTQVGLEIQKYAANNLKRTSLELGGKSANIILEDADLSLAIDGALYAFLYHTGQACDSGTRLLVHKNIYESFVTKLLQRIKDVPVGLPHLAETALGPVINEKQFQRIMNYIECSKKEGAKLLFGGTRLLENAKGDSLANGFFITPTVFEVTPEHTIFKDEIFGPVLGITSFATDEEAINLANNSEYGLAAAIWSKDAEKALALAKELEAGTIWINEYHLLNPGMPFGGFKKSGLGRELGREGLLSYLEVSHIWESDCNSREKKIWFDAIF